jgi:hypothetical protein
VRFNPAAGTATWTDISYDLLDQPVNDAVLDVVTGDIYISTDFGVARLAEGAQTWIPAAGPTGCGWNRAHTVLPSPPSGGSTVPRLRLAQPGQGELEQVPRVAANTRLDRSRRLLPQLDLTGVAQEL